MAVPKTGKFKMFKDGVTGTFSIEGAVSASITDYDDTDRFSGSAHVIGQSVGTLFDEDFSSIVELNKINISSSQQFRGYPIEIGKYLFTMKCAQSASYVIPDPIDDPDTSGSLIIVTSDGDSTSWGVGDSGITGSTGEGDNSWPVDPDYDIFRIKCDPTDPRAQLELVIDPNGNSTPPPTFTSMTISGSDGSNTYDFCDLVTSASYGNYYRYQWLSSGCPNFSDGNQLTVTFNTASIDYWVTCDPAIPSGNYTRTGGSVTQQQECDQVTSENIYFHNNEVSSTNPVEVGDYAYSTSDGRTPFNGGSKYYGIATSSAGNLMSVPDVTARIASNGEIVSISECTPTPPYEPPLNSYIYECDYTNNTNTYTSLTSNLGAGEYSVYQFDGSNDTIQSFSWASYDRPNKFTLYDNSSTFANPIYTTGWVGQADYYNAAGKDQWTNPLNTAPSGGLKVTWGSSTGRKVRIDYGLADPDNIQGDVARFVLLCSSSLTPLQVAQGNTVTDVCGANIDDDTHWHYHPTSSFGTAARVYNDNDGLDHITGSSKYYAYTSSIGTRYYYQVPTTDVFGSISNHNSCPGTDIAAVLLIGTGGADCDTDTDGAIDNRVYVASNLTAFTVSGGKLKIDNDNLTISSQQDTDIYVAGASGVNFDPQTISSGVSTILGSAQDGTFMVADNSLANPSGTKVLATVQAGVGGGAPTIAFTPCAGAGGMTPPSFGGGGCTRVYTSNGFTSADFSGTDPTDSMCNPSNWSSYNAAIDIDGLQVSDGDDFYNNLTCTGGSNYGNTYYTIYEPVQGSTFIIRMDDTSGTEIKEVWTCGASDIQTSGDNTYYLSTPFGVLGDDCGGSYTVSTSTTSDASSIATGLHYVVYKDGARFNGNNKYYIVDTATRTTTGEEGETKRYWKIDRAGIVQDVSLLTCGGSGGNE